MSAVARARRPPSSAFLDPPGYARHRPERTLLYRLVEQHYPALRELRAAADRPLADFVQQEFEAYLTCGRLEEGFLRVRCESCHDEKLVAFSCKKRGFCPSFGGRRIPETAALLADEVLPDRPLRQWVLSLPHALRFLLATHSEALTLVLGEVYRTISRHLAPQRPCFVPRRLPSRATCRRWSSRSPDAFDARWNVAAWSSSRTWSVQGRSSPRASCCWWREGPRRSPACCELKDE